MGRGWCIFVGVRDLKSRRGQDGRDAAIWTVIGSLSSTARPRPTLSPPSNSTSVAPATKIFDTFRLPLDFLLFTFVLICRFAQLAPFIEELRVGGQGPDCRVRR